MANEIAVIETFDLTAVNDSATALQQLRDELGSDFRPSFAFAKTPSSGMTAWQIKTSDDDDDPEICKVIEGVILYSHKNNAYWAEGLDGGAISGPPDCRSMDGITGLTQDNITLECASCPFNQFGSDNGKGKACKNGRRIYLMREGDMLPIRIDLAPTGLKPYDKYVENLLLPKKRGQKPMRTAQVITRIGLKLETSKDGIKYSVPYFEAVGAVPDSARAALLSCADAVKAAAQNFTPVSDSDIPPEFTN